MKYVEHLIGLCLVAVVLCIALAASSSAEPARWVDIKHEGGTEYIVRRDAVIGFGVAAPGAPRGADRNRILLTNGKELYTRLSLDEFNALVGRDE